MDECVYLSVRLYFSVFFWGGGDVKMTPGFVGIDRNEAVQSCVLAKKQSSGFTSRLFRNQLST